MDRAAHVTIARLAIERLHNQAAMEDDPETCPYPPPRCPDMRVEDPFDERPRAHAHGCGELGLALEKHLAGCSVNISERDFILWARIGDAPDEAHRVALREALLNMQARETRRTAFDGRASTRQICRLVVQCGAATSPEWNSLIRILHPEIPVPNLPENPMRDKALMWRMAGDGMMAL